MKRWFSKELKGKNRTKAPVGIAHMCYQIKKIFLVISASNESQVTSSETKLGVYDDLLRGEGLDSLKYAPRHHF